MFAASTYEEIERIESQVENMEIVVFLFARPTEEKILKEFEYIHYNSAKYCSIYAIGYTDDFAKAEDQTYRKVDAMMQRDWYFSTKAFTEFKEKLQDRIRWNYSGETEVLVLQNNPGQKNVLNFQNYVAINVNKGIREEYIDSFQSFMESLIRSSKRRVTAKEAIRDVRNSRISVKDILAGAIDDCKKVPTPVKEITRLKHLSESEQGDFFDKTSFSSIDDYIRDIIGVSQLLNIDISNLDDTATEVVTKVFSKMLFDYLRALSPRNSMPINLILEEAHRFVRSDMDYGVLGYNIFERIAKEGRKFGLLMGISSQRPSELSKTVVSQCNNFIIHKIQNPDDIQYISRMVPYMNQGMVDRITYLRRGYALVFGTAINLPTLTAFEKASPSPNSGNSNIVEKWYVD